MLAAQRTLAELEARHRGRLASPAVPAPTAADAAAQRLRDVAADTLTPRAALELVYTLKELVGGDGPAA